MAKNDSRDAQNGHQYLQRLPKILKRMTDSGISFRSIHSYAGIRIAIQFGTKSEPTAQKAHPNGHKTSGSPDSCTNDQNSVSEWNIECNHVPEDQSQVTSPSDQNSEFRSTYTQNRSKFPEPV